MTSRPDILKDSGQLKWRRLKQVCGEPKFLLSPGYKPAEQLTSALPIPKTSHWVKAGRGASIKRKKRHDDGWEVSD